MMQWCIKLIQKYKKTAIHVFCLDFSSALLANLLHASTTLELLESNQNLTNEIMDSILDLINDDRDVNNLPTSTLIHLLICLSYLSKERFSKSIDDTQFVDRISMFVESFSQKQIGDTINKGKPTNSKRTKGKLRKTTKYKPLLSMNPKRIMKQK